MQAIVAKKMNKYKIYQISTTALLYLILAIGVVVLIFPIFWVIVTAIKPSSEIFRLPLRILPSKPTLQNFTRLSQLIPIGRLLFNGFFLAGITCVSSVFFATMIGYGLAKFRITGATLIFYVILSAVMVPTFIRVIPLYLMMVKIGGINTYWGVILPNYISVFGIFFMRQYAGAIPMEFIEAARIDGASEPHIFISIIFPLMKSACITLALLKFLWTWNDFLWPLIMLSDKKMMTLAVALVGFKGINITLYSLLMAGAVLLILPVLIFFFVLQRYIVQGIALTGLKS